MQRDLSTLVSCAVTNHMKVDESNCISCTWVGPTPATRTDWSMRGWRAALWKGILGAAVNGKLNSSQPHAPAAKRANCSLWYIGPGPTSSAREGIIPFCSLALSTVCFGLGIAVLKKINFLESFQGRATTHSLQLCDRRL